MEHGFREIGGAIGIIRGRFGKEKEDEGASPRRRTTRMEGEAYNPPSAMKSFDETLIEVWRQALVENAESIQLGPERYPVRRTPKKGLRQVDFVLDGSEIRGLEQNPDTKSRWAQLARSGKRVMQFLREGRYLANVVDGKVHSYRD